MARGSFDPTVTTVQELGDRCKTATETEACNADSSTHHATAARSVITTAGNTVNVLQDEAIDAFVAPPDSAQDAQLMVWRRGFSVACTDGERGGLLDVGDGWEILATQLTSACTPVETKRFVLFVGRDGSFSERESEVLESDPNSCIGRRPPGLQRVRKRPGSPLARRLATHAHLEAAAVPAFERLAAELTAFDAPRELIRACRQAAAEEVRHARIVGELARGRGLRPPPPKVTRLPLRSPLEVALDNATEGCVRELWGAVVGLCQAERADARDVRAVMGDVARDEIGHAALSLSLSSWLEPRLSPSERVRVHAARRAAAHGVVADRPDAIDRELGQVDVRFATG